MWMSCPEVTNLGHSNAGTGTSSISCRFVGTDFRQSSGLILNRTHTQLLHTLRLSLWLSRPAPASIPLPLFSTLDRRLLELSTLDGWRSGLRLRGRSRRRRGGG
uniref:(northern house mosquito) hypothetical protein n=1 Tax=Culex pipiens TaxID=7175 RepID=A0A8D8L3E1_CULPI